MATVCSPCFVPLGSFFAFLLSGFLDKIKKYNVLQIYMIFASALFLYLFYASTLSALSPDIIITLVTYDCPQKVNRERN